MEVFSVCLTPFIKGTDWSNGNFKSKNTDSVLLKIKFHIPLFKKKDVRISTEELMHVIKNPQLKY
jgi:hypothetical protein